MNDTTHTRFTILVYPHIKKFMRKKFPLYKGVFKSEETTQLGSIIVLCLRDNRLWKNTTGAGSGNERYKEKLTEEIELQLTEEQGRMSPRLYKFVRLNLDLDRLFQYSLLEWIQAQGATGIPVIQACRSFLEYYDIDPDGDEYKLDRAYKAWQRKGRDEE